MTDDEIKRTREGTKLISQTRNWLGLCLYSIICFTSNFFLCLLWIEKVYFLFAERSTRGKEKEMEMEAKSLHTDLNRNWIAQTAKKVYFSDSFWDAVALFLFFSRVEITDPTTKPSHIYYSSESVPLDNEVKGINWW